MVPRVIALVLACTGGLPAPSGAQAASVSTSLCRTDDAARGLASSPVAGSLVPVSRADGRVDQFQLFHDATATGGLPFVWHREQAGPGAAYGSWERVSAATVGPKSYYVTAAENADGRVELLFSAYGQFCHSVQDVNDLEWTAPEPFGLAPGPYMGGVVLFKERDGSLDALASTTTTGRSMEVRAQQSPGDVWGPVQSMGKVPEANIGLSQPSTVTELPGGRLHVTVHEWNRDTRFWQVTQLAPHGAWGPWQPCVTPRCA
ncbi:hypothetical protein ACFYXH_12205 [Streptomyces sp. NPDC002730]|uniref:hypothetical protein n=1 Tax=Streptomyces sp. NPDC002730 TaxID=3364662 RepID=UPI0036B133F4